MVRQLVEGGACVLSSTLSDMETPVEKCEEEEEGYDGCLRYLTAAYHATGTINDGKVRFRVSNFKRGSHTPPISGLRSI